MLVSIGTLGVITVAILYFGSLQEMTAQNIASPTENDVAASTTTTPNADIATSSKTAATAIPPAVAKTKPVEAKAAPRSATQEAVQVEESIETKDSQDVYRIQNPYQTAPKGFTIVNDEARGALVNIFCTTQGGGSVRPISASGIIIDPRGVILTNAHVAQYVLLASDSRVNLSCTARTGSPARAKWFIDILYVPPIWVELHASDIISSRPLGTGEYDYALLRITGPSDGSTSPAIPHLLPDTRDAIGFTDDSILVASYPAEFVGTSAYYDLNVVSTITTIKELLTFEQRSVDAISLGGIIGAQSGSSGGAVVNAWGRLIGLITTTSEGPTTAERNLRAITLSYIDRDLRQRTGAGLAETLSGNLILHSQFYREYQAPQLIQLLMNAIENR